MTVLISNSVRHDTQNFALLSANFGPAYVEENSYSFSIQISKTTQILLFRHATKCCVNPPPPPPHHHSPNRNMRSVGEHLLSDPMVMGSNLALGTPSWTEIQFHESTDVMRGKLGCQVAGVKTTAWQLFCGITLP